MSLYLNKAETCLWIFNSPSSFSFLLHYAIFSRVTSWDGGRIIASLTRQHNINSHRIDTFCNNIIPIRICLDTISLIWVMSCCTRQRLGDWQSKHTSPNTIKHSILSNELTSCYMNHIWHTASLMALDQTNSQTLVAAIAIRRFHYSIYQIKSYNLKYAPIFEEVTYSSQFQSTRSIKQ